VTATAAVAERPVERVVARLEHVRRDRDGWRARCPVCRRDLSVTEGSDGRVMLDCDGRCEAQAITGALGLELADLFVQRARPALAAVPDLEPVAVHDYTDAEGVVLYQVCRVDCGDHDEGRPRRPDPAAPGRWLWGMGDVEPVLFRLPQVLDAVADGKRVWIVEDERDVDTLTTAGYAATTPSGGLLGWREAHAALFQGADVVVAPVPDAEGRSFAEQVAASLANAGAAVRVVELSGAGATDGVTDWVEARENGFGSGPQTRSRASGGFWPSCWRTTRSCARRCRSCRGSRGPRARRSSRRGTRPGNRPCSATSRRR
jgi:putative DNA primase/helicase